MSTELTKRDPGAIMEQVIAKGDLSQITPQERVQYYRAVCESLGLNPLTQPFQYISLQGKLTLYATRAATDQLRKIHGVSTTLVSEQERAGIWIVKAKATDKEGRSEESTGAVTIEGLKGDALCNALMKAETKAKRRATLALVGLGWLDESETETIPGARMVPMEALPSAALKDEPVMPAAPLCPDCIVAKKPSTIGPTDGHSAEVWAAKTKEVWGVPVCKEHHDERKARAKEKKAEKALQQAMSGVDDALEGI